MKSKLTFGRLQQIRSSALLLFALLLSVGTLQAQTPQYSVGSLTAGSNVIPFGNGSSWNSYRCQFLYLPGQFGVVPTGMAISKIYFVPTSSGTATFTDFNVAIGQSNITGLSASSWVTGLATALSESSYTFSYTSSQWWQITLTTPIPYDPSMPLIVDAWKTSSTQSIGLRNQSASPGNRRAYSPFPSATPSGASTTMYTFGFDLVPLAPDNAGITALISPVNFCGGNYPVQVELTNSGLNTLTSATIDWELDNIPQPSFNWTGSLATGAKTTVTIGNNLPFGATIRTIKAWSSLPNGMADTVNADDTLNDAARAGLNGVYVVGATGDFPTVVDAANTLNKYGVCGPVTMDIQSGTYTSDVQLNNIYGASATNRITFKSQTGNPSNVVIRALPGATGHVFALNSASYITIKNVTIQSDAGTNDGRVLTFAGSASHDSVLNCTINCSPGATGSNTAGIYGGGLGDASDNVFINNRINRGYYGIYWEGTGTAASSLTKDHIFDNNTITDAYVYSTYFYYTSNLKFRYNKISAINSPTTHYGLYGYYNDNAFEVIGNEFVITGPGTKYGIRPYYSDGTSANPGLIVNNTVAIDCGSSTAYGIFNYYSNYQYFVNNSVSVNSTSTSSYAARFYYSSTSYKNNVAYNNAFSNVTGDGYTMYVYSTTASYNNTWDYNNLHNGKDQLVERGTPANTYKTLAAWQAASDQDDHSISYDPGFMSLTDLRPDPNNPASWSLNGRGLHLDDNVMDIANNPRAETRPDGVPDIGAYEFAPEVAPPVAEVSPAIPAPGQTQIFTFGQREVARVTWGHNAPAANLEVRQYSGEKGIGVAAAASPFGSMYFHTDVKSMGNVPAFDYDFKVHYMDIWLGDIGNENDLRLAQKVASYPWMVYSDLLSSSNAAANEINASALNRFGSFTGLENGSIPSAFVRSGGKVIICVGNSVQLRAEPQTGDFYKWYLNGLEIPGASGPSATTYNATLAGDYTVAITYGGKIVESVPLAITTIAAPNAIINSNGPLTYCIGNGLTLDAGTAQGVSYQWQLDGNNIPGATSNTYPVNQSGNYTVIVENIGCATTSTITPVTSGPISVNLGNDTSYCEVKNVWATLDAGYPGAKYLWSTGDTSRVIEVRNGGTYWVNVDAGPNCQGSDQIEVTIDPLPKANGISFVRNGNTYQFYPSGPIGATGFLWLFSDGSTSTVDNPVKSIDGELYVRLVMFNQCGSDTVQLGWPLTVTNTVEENTITVFPNPANDYINIHTGSAAISELMVINSVGAVVNTVNTAAGQQEYRMNVANLPAGNYMLRATTSEGIINKQFNIIR